MGRFLYYIPGVPGVSREMLADRSLEGRFRRPDGTYVEYGVTPGPGPAGNGCIVALGTQVAEYDPSRQRWEEGPGFWTGLEGDAPGPAELARTEGVDGYEVTLGDGRAWVVPVVRAWHHDALEHRPALPRAMSRKLVDGKPRVTFELRPEFRAVDAVAEHVFGLIATEAAFSYEDGFGAASLFLGVNYRMWEAEASLLGLFDADNILRVLKAGVDIPALERTREMLARGGR